MRVFRRHVARLAWGAHGCGSRQARHSPPPPPTHPLHTIRSTHPSLLPSPPRAAALNDDAAPISRPDDGTLRAGVGGSAGRVVRRLPAPYAVDFAALEPGGGRRGDTSYAPPGGAPHSCGPAGLAASALEPQCCTMWHVGRLCRARPSPRGSGSAAGRRRPGGERVHLCMCICICASAWRQSAGRLNHRHSVEILALTPIIMSGSDARVALRLGILVHFVFALASAAAARPDAAIDSFLAWFDTHGACPGCARRFKSSHAWGGRRVAPASHYAHRQPPRELA